MPVDSRHPQYTKFEKQQEKCRDAYEGEEQVKEKTTKYLPLLTGMTKNSNKYKSYLDRAMFYSATRRTVEGMTGIVDRKPPTIEIADGLPWAEDIDGNGMSLHGFTNQIIAEGVLIGWQGILVDRRDDYDQPYPVQYRAEQIINWHYDNGELVMVMLHEEVHELGDDYAVEIVDQWRELVIEEGIYTVKIHRKTQQGKFEVVSTTTPSKRGERLTTIPFTFVSSNNKLERPPLMDMVEVNFHHYKNSADYEHGLHFTGLPTGYISGLQNITDNNGNPIKVEIGSETCILLPEGGSAGYMEFTGQGLSTLTGAMDTKKQEMASLGARLLQSDKRAAEAAETARINKSGDSNVIASIVTGVERALNQTLRYMSEWESVSPESNTIELNRDYIDEGMDAQQITAMVGAMQAGAMTKEVLAYNFKKNDLYPDDRTVDEELAALDSAAPDLNTGMNFDEDDEEGDEE